MTIHDRSQNKFRRGTIEALESRHAMASAAGVENILLPEFMAQMADPNGNEYWMTTTPTD